jgi:hypothetical protein
MKVFISWSGARSRIVAEALRGWLPNVINAVEPFVSEEDIDKGAIGTEVIARQLRDSAFGIVCLTRDNQTRPWINYEAGALSKVVGDNEARVATVLIDIASPAGVTGPLSAFQATQVHDRGQMKQLVRSLAKAAGDARSKETLDDLVDLIWESFASIVTEERLAASGEASTAPTRKPEDMFGELLTLMRQVSQDVSRLTPRSPDGGHDETRDVRSAVSAIFRELAIAGIASKYFTLQGDPDTAGLSLSLEISTSADLKSRLTDGANKYGVALKIIENGTESLSADF